LQGETHTNFKLSKGGESLGIFAGLENNFAPVDFLEFESQTTDVSYGRSPNGIGDFKVLDYYSPNADNDINTDIKEKYSEQLDIYPNPTNDRIFIRSNYKGCSYRIYNMNGSEISSGTYDESIFINQLLTGVYQIEVLHQKALLTDKFVVLD